MRQPARVLVERVARRQAKPRQLHGLVAPERLHATGARAIGAFGDLPDERRGFERCPAVGERADDEQTLPGAEVQADVDGEIGVRAKQGIVHRLLGYSADRGFARKGVPEVRRRASFSPDDSTESAAIRVVAPALRLLWSWFLTAVAGCPSTATLFVSSHARYSCACWLS